jgi:hypothetical protein
VKRETEALHELGIAGPLMIEVMRDGGRPLPAPDGSDLDDLEPIPPARAPRQSDLVVEDRAKMR